MTANKFWIGRVTSGRQILAQSIISLQREEASYIPINDPSLALVIEQSVRKVLLEKGESYETISLLKEIKEQLKVIASEIKERKAITEELVVFRSITKREAKKEIKKYFKVHKGEVVGYSDLVRNLKLDLKLVVDICSELETEGIIG